MAMQRHGDSIAGPARGTPLLGALSLACVVAACGSPAGKKNCAPRTGQGVILATTFPLQGDAGGTIEPIAGSASSPTPRMLGGLLALTGVDRVNQKNALEAKSSDVRFIMPESCSVALEVRKEGDGYGIDAFTSNGCLMQKLVFRGSAPVLQVFRPARGSERHGYEAVPITIPELAARDAILTDLDGIPDAGPAQRVAMIDLGVNVHRVKGARLGLSAPTEAALLKEMCLEIPKPVMDEWNARPAAQRGVDPRESTSPDPRSCQFLVDGHWFSFGVPAAAAVGKKALLDELVAETEAYKAYRAQKSGVDPSLLAILDDLKRKGRAAHAADSLWRRWQVALYAVRADCASSIANNTIFCGAQKDRFVDVVRKRILPEGAALVEEVRASGYAKESARKVVDRLNAAVAESDRAVIDYARSLKAVQDAMRASSAKVGIATNQIRNVDAKRISLVYKDLPVIPADGKLAPELAHHSFRFDNPWLDMAFPKANAHPLVTNLHNEVNDGYAITFAGYPVGALLADTDHSGGASVIALPSRSKDAAVQERGKAEADKGAVKPSRETTTSDGPEGC